MSLEDQKRALRLYKGYKCDTAEYRELAAKYGMNTGELNLWCWHQNHPKSRLGMP